MILGKWAKDAETGKPVDKARLGHAVLKLNRYAVDLLPSDGTEKRHLGWSALGLQGYVVTSTGIKRVQKFVQLLCAVFSGKVADMDTLNRVNAEINNTLTKYPLVKTVYAIPLGVGQGIIEVQQKAGNPSMFAVLSDYIHPSETEAIHAALDLAKWGVLHVLPKCICGEYFLATKRKQLTCSTKCAKRLYARKQSRKDEHSKYMQGFAHLWERPKPESIKLAE